MFCCFVDFNLAVDLIFNFNFEFSFDRKLCLYSRPSLYPFDVCTSL